MGRIDLHIHTTYSDGTVSPSDVVTLAHQAGLKALSITDHDTTDGLPEGLKQASRLGIECLPGIEISSQFQGKETHILGYGLAWNDPTFQDRLLTLRQSRHARNPEMIQRLTDLGLSLTYDEVKAVAGSDSVGRPHIAQVLLSKGYVSGIQEAFSRYLGNGGAAYVPRDLPETTDVIAWIREVGGLAVLAHPTWIHNSPLGVRQSCEKLKAGGLQGLEVFYGTHSSRETSEYLNLARRLDLLITGGSDFHGAVKPDIAIGVGRGKLKVPDSLLDPLKQALGSKRG